MNIKKKRGFYNPNSSNVFPLYFIADGASPPCQVNLGLTLIGYSFSELSPNITAEPVSFEGKIDFTGLTKGPAFLEIHNDNPSDLRENDKSILIPIVIE